LIARQLVNATVADSLEMPGATAVARVDVHRMYYWMMRVAALVRSAGQRGGRGVFTSHDGKGVATGEQRDAGQVLDVDDGRRRR
jgi:hypothetical protein